MKKFNRRLYKSFGDFLTDMRTVMSQRENIRGMMRGLDPAFRERLFLAVTAVSNSETRVEELLDGAERVMFASEFEVGDLRRAIHVETFHSG